MYTLHRAVGERIRAAQELRKDGQLEEAIALLRSTIAEYPGDALAAQVQLASMLISTSACDEARDLSLEALRDPRMTERPEWRVVALIDYGIATRELAIRRREDGDATGAQRGFRRARTVLTEALDQQPEHPLAHFHLARTLRELGDISLSTHHFIRAMRFAPHHAPSDVAEWITQWCITYLAQEDNREPPSATRAAFRCAAQSILDRKLSWACASLHDLADRGSDRDVQGAARAFLSHVCTKAASALEALAHAVVS